MLNYLYDCFKKWSDGGSIYLMGDTHFDDQDCKFMDENWPDPQTQIDIINKIVMKNDTFILLGDVGNAEWVSKIKSRNKILIMGNHDCGASKYIKSGVFLDWLLYDDAEKLVRKDPSLYIDKVFGFTACVYKRVGYFDEVYTGPLFISDKILLSHEPIDGLTFCLNIHGHDHNNTFKSSEGCKHINLASNVNSFTPSNLNTLIKNGALSGIKGIHREYIDNRNKEKII